MSELSGKHCVPCEGGVQPLSRAEAQNLMRQLKPDWKLADDAKSLQTELKFRNFFHTMSFANALAHIANAEDHHP
ncbi:MAG: 4a-hydroxytetrahydrobiopterin dehydratase, partial [Steroidobacteraceae bacterium]